MLKLLERLSLLEDLKSPVNRPYVIVNKSYVEPHVNHENSEKAKKSTDAYYERARTITKSSIFHASQIYAPLLKMKPNPKIFSTISMV